METMEKSLTQLFTELDGAVKEVAQKEKEFKEIERKAYAEIREAEEVFARVKRDNESKLSNSQGQLIEVVNKARALQQEVQDRTTGLLNQSGRVRGSR